MGMKELVDYIRQYSNQGYSISSIRANLLASGYTAQEIDTAVEKAFHKGPTIPWKIILFILAGILIFGLLVYGLLLLLSPSSSSLVGLTITNAQTQLIQGQPLSFTRTVSLPTSVAETISISYDLIHDTTRERVHTETEEVTIDGIDRSAKTIVLDSNARAGRYILKITAFYQGEEITQSHFFDYQSISSQIPGTSDITRTPGQQDNLLTPSAPGVCQPACNDYDPCTVNKCIDGACVFEAKTPCCGNFECEAGESEATCSQDCKVRPLTQGEAILEIRKRAEEAAEKNPGDAVNLCRSIAVAAQADSCMKAVAYGAQRSDICKHINGVKLRDACYLDFALKNKQSSVCNEVQDRWMKQSCVVYTNAPSQV